MKPLACANLKSTPPLFSYRQYWAKRFGSSTFLPLSREEMDDLGWDSCDIILVTGDAYVDHPSFGMALIGRLLENQGFRVGILSQPNWHDTQDFMRLGPPNLFFGITSGNMDAMVNHYTADRRIRRDDAYTPKGVAGKRPDRAVTVYAQRCREAYKRVPIIIGGIEASLRRMAHYDYWSDKVRRSILFDAKADLLVYGNGERAVVEIAHRLAASESIQDLIDIRGTAFACKQVPSDYIEVDSSTLEVATDVSTADAANQIMPDPNPYQMTTPSTCATTATPSTVKPQTQIIHFTEAKKVKRNHQPRVIRLPAYEAVKQDKVLYAHASRIFHAETNPGNAIALVQRHGKQELWVNPPPLPLTTSEFDGLFDFSYQRVPHPSYADANIPAYEMIRFSVNIMRGCFGGCTFCSITEHEGRIIQSRSEDSIIREIETIRDQVPGFTGVISDLGGPTANMYRLACKDKTIEAACRRPSCVYPGICSNLGTNHQPLIKLYRRARTLPGVKKVLIASGLRYDLAITSPEYVKELVTHHVGGYLKIAPEHTEAGPLDKMLKPGIAAYDRFKAMFDRYSQQAGKEQYLIPYFIAAHPGTTDEDMLNLALWLKRNGFRADQVQAFLPSPMAVATTMYHTEKNPLRKISDTSQAVTIPKGLKVRRLHKAFLRYHDAHNWPLLRDALKRMGRADLIGNGKRHLVPTWQPRDTGQQSEGLPVNRDVRYKRMATQHTGLPLHKQRLNNRRLKFGN